VQLNDFCGKKIKQMVAPTKQHLRIILTDGSVIDVTCLDDMEISTLREEMVKKEVKYILR
jgi:hypothetical protein